MIKEELTHLCALFQSSNYPVSALFCKCSSIKVTQYAAKPWVMTSIWQVVLEWRLFKYIMPYVHLRPSKCKPTQMGHWKIKFIIREEERRFQVGVTWWGKAQSNELLKSV